MTPEREKLAKNYETLQNLFFLLDQAVLALFLFILLIGGGESLSLRLWEKVDALCGNFFLATPLYLLLIQIAYLILTAPYDYVKEYRVEKKFDLSEQTFGGWLKDQAKSAALSLLLVVMALFFCYACMPSSPR